MADFGFSLEYGSGGSGGDFLPIVKFDARDGMLTRVDRNNDGGAWASIPVDITENFKALVDLENLETGWIAFVAGTPSFVMVPYGSIRPAQPSKDHKPGVRFMMKLAKECGGDIREMASNSKAFCRGVSQLYDAFEAERGNHPGLLPVVVAKKPVPVYNEIGGKQMKSYEPRFEIVDWKPRGDLVFQPKGSSEKPAARPNGAPPSTGSTRVEPPKQPIKIHDNQILDGSTRVEPPANPVETKVRQQMATIASEDDFG